MPEPKKKQHHRWILVVLAVGLGVTIILALLAGSAETFSLLFNANLVFVGGIVLFQTLRYVALMISTRVVAEIVGIRAPLLPLFQVTVASAAANRTFVGGAAGLVIRGAFFLQRGMHSGSFVAMEGVEDVASLCAVALLFVTGLTFVAANGGGAGLRWDVIGAFIVGILLLVIGVVAFLRRRVLVERVMDALARGIDSIVARVLRRNIYNGARVLEAVNDFYRTLELARQDPPRVFISFCCSLARLSCDWLALYCAFRAIGYGAALETVLLIFIISTSVATVAAVPGQIGVMEATYAFMSTALGIPPPIAVSATLLYRLISFWLPVPFGYLFAWRLERRGEI